RSLRRWWDDDGMRHWHLSIDPESAARLDGALDAHVEALFHRDRNDGEVTRTSEQLACDALGHLVAGGHAATRPGRAEISVIVDYDTLRSGLHEHSVHVDNNGQLITPEAIRRLACDADILPIVLSGGTVPLDMGRKVRTATHEQRLALAAIYPGCAISDCQVRYTHCEVHHTVEWDDHGYTDLDNLVPDLRATPPPRPRRPLAHDTRPRPHTAPLATRRHPRLHPPTTRPRSVTLRSPAPCRWVASLGPPWV
nr:HNH endonuclease [Actinomycetota bacterium]